MNTMKKTLLLTLLALSGALGTAGLASAQVAGSTTLGISVIESAQVAMGWSVKKSVLGKTVYTESGEKIGKVEDMIITPEQYVSYLIVGAGGFIGIGRHDVAVPVAQVREQGGKLVMPGATKDVVKSMPEFSYATSTTERDRFVAAANADIAKGKATMADVEKKAAAATGDAKTKLSQQKAALAADLKGAETKMADMNKAGAKRWKEFEADVGAATARLRKSIESALA